MKGRISVSVIGQGQMGSALARVLIGRGFDVTVWNRSQERTGPAAALGAVIARSPAEAVAASEVVIVSLIDVRSATDAIEKPEVLGHMSGKLLVQLSSGTPQDMEHQARLVKTVGCRFLAGGILCFPSTIGQTNTLIVYAGDHAAFEQYRELFATLSGTAHYLGEEPATAVMVYFALGTFIMGAQGLFYETAAALAKSHMNITGYYLLIRLCADQIAIALNDGVHRVRDDAYDDSQCSIEVYRAYLQEVWTAFDRTGVASPMIKALLDQLSRISAMGYRDKDLSALVPALSRQ